MAIRQSSPLTPPHSAPTSPLSNSSSPLMPNAQSSPEGEASGYSSKESSPTSSENDSTSPSFDDGVFPHLSSSASSSSHHHSSSSSFEPLKSTKPQTSGPYFRPPTLRPLRPLAQVQPAQAPAPHGPKSQPLSRALFAKMANEQHGTPHAGMTVGGGGKKVSGGGGKQKLIVPTKSFRTTFELGLTASELARR